MLEEEEGVLAGGQVSSIFHFRGICQRLSGFNWKEKRILGLTDSRPSGSIPLNFTGPFSHLQSQIDLTKGDYLLDLKKPKNESDVLKFKDHLRKLENGRSVLQIHALFGSSKSSGFLQKKRF
jgi:hypothetical protein